MDEQQSVIRARVSRDEHRRAKALCALRDVDLQDWAGEAVRRRLAEDEAAQRDEAARQRPAEPQTEGGE